ncbi:MAG TPA: hypothetical protein VJN92_17865 [Candidatus Acidoferrum sp.]|nr:hypothetical protein [Candidatus Acidoferrum sp.]
MGEKQILKGLVTARKLTLAGFSIVLLVDPLFAPKDSNPGYGASIFLAWALLTRLWLQNPSNGLLILCIAVSCACIASNHGLVSLSIVPQSFYFYLAVGILIAYWEKGTGLANRVRSRSA